MMLQRGIYEWSPIVFWMPVQDHWLPPTWVSKIWQILGKEKVALPWSTSRLHTDFLLLAHVVLDEVEGYQIGNVLVGSVLLVLGPWLFTNLTVCVSFRGLNYCQRVCFGRNFEHTYLKIGKWSDSQRTYACARNLTGHLSVPHSK